MLGFMALRALESSERQRRPPLRLFRMHKGSLALNLRQSGNFHQREVPGIREISEA
jgi:hypothetical protein